METKTFLKSEKNRTRTFQEDLFQTPLKFKQQKENSFSSKHDQDPTSPYFYLKTKKMNAEPPKKIQITKENFDNYQQLAETSLKTGNPDQAVYLYRECIDGLIEINGADSEKYEFFFTDTIKALCNHAMKSLNKNNMYSCFNILFECNEMVEPNNSSEPNIEKKYFPNLHAMILNNLGCAYRRINKDKKAYQYLKEALRIVFKYKIEAFLGLTYLNLCSVTSQMGFHSKALQYAKNSLIYCQNDFLNLIGEKKYEPQIYREKVHLVAVCFYNLAVEEEFHRDYDKALEWYKKAYLFIEEKLGPNEKSIKKFRLAYENTKEKMIDNLVNPNKSELPKVPVEKTLKKFYQPKLNLMKSVTKKPHKPKSPGLEIYSKNISDIKNAHANKTSVFYYNRQHRPNSSKTYNNSNTSQKIPKTNAKLANPSIMLAFSEPEENPGIMNLKINNYLVEDEPTTGVQKINLDQLENEYQENETKPNNLKIKDFREIGELEKSGVLNWDDSDTLSEEKFSTTIKQKRKNFLHDLEKYENATTKQNFYSHKNKMEISENFDDHTGLNRNFDLYEETLNEINKENNDFAVKNEESLLNLSHSLVKMSESLKKNESKLSESMKKSQELSKRSEKKSLILMNPDKINENSLVVTKQEEKTNNTLEKPNFLNFSMDNGEIRKHPKPNYSTQSARVRRPYKSFSKELKNEFNNENYNMPKFMKVIVKIKDIEIQTDDEPTILPEHLRFEGDDNSLIFLDFNKDKIHFDLSENNIIRIEKLQKFYKERFKQKMLVERKRNKIILEKIKIIQRFFRMSSCKIHFKMKREAFLNNKLLLKQKIIKKIAPSSSFFDYYSYFLRVFLLKSVKSLNWILYDFVNKKIIENFMDIEGILEHEGDINNKENLKILSSHIENMVDSIEIIDGYIEFKPKISETIDQSLELERQSELNSKKNEEIAQGIFQVNKETIEKVIYLQNKFRQVYNKELYEAKKEKKYSIILTMNKKISYNSYIRLSYCSNISSKENEYRYIAGAILTDITYKVNTVRLADAILKAYNNQITQKNIFEIISVDLHKKTISLTEDAKFKIELQEKLEFLKNQKIQMDFDSAKIIRIQSYIRGINARRDYIIKKEYYSKKKNAVNLTKKYLIREDELYFLHINYLKFENSILFKARSFKNYVISSENKQKLFEVFSLNELRYFSDIISHRISIKHQDNKKIKIIVPRIEELISEKKHEGLDLDGSSKLLYEKDPLLETKYKYSKEFIKTSLDNDYNLLRLLPINHKLNKHSIRREDTEEIEALKHIQRFMRNYFFKNKFLYCLAKKIKRTDITNLDKFFNIKDLAFLEDSPLKKKNKPMETEKKKVFKNKKKISQDPYKKDIIVIRKLNHVFNNKEPAKLKVFYHIYFHTVIIDIKFKNVNRSQQITNPLSFFGMKDFNKSYFTKNFNEIVLKRLHYVENEQIVYYIKEENREPAKNKTNIAKPGNSPSKSIEKFYMSPEKRKEFELRSIGERNHTTSIFLDKIHQKLQDEYFDMQLFVDLEDNALKFKAKKFDDPFQTMEKKIFLPSIAREFLDVEKENVEKVKTIFQHYLKTVKENIKWNEKSLANEKMSAQFKNILRVELSAVKIQNNFRKLKEKKQFELLKFSEKKSKKFIMRKFYKINGNYTDVLFFLLPNRFLIEIKASNLSHKKRNVKLFRLNIKRVVEKSNNLQIKSKENLISLAINVIKALSIKVVNENIHIIPNEDVLIENEETFVESDKEFHKRARKKSSFLALMVENETKLLNKPKISKLLKEYNSNVSQEQKSYAAARLIQTHVKIMRLRKLKEFNKLVLNAKTIYLMKIIEKIQGSYILVYFYYLKSCDEILINIANLNKKKSILKSYTIDIPSISQDLHKILLDCKTSIEKQRPKYYQKIFRDLLKFLWKRVEISFLFEKIVVTSLDRNLKLVDVSESKKKKRDVEENEKKNSHKKRLKYITTLQKVFRKNKTKYLFTLFKDRLRKLADEEKKYGKKIKQKIKIFNQIPFYIYVYLKSEEMLTFLAIRKERKNSLKISRSYYLDKLKLINTNGIDVVDFLILHLRVYDDQIIFDTENLVALKEESIENPNEVQIDSPEIKRKFYNLMKISNGGKSLENNSEIFNKDVNLNYLNSANESTKPQFKIIHQKRDGLNDSQLCVFNVFLTNSKGNIDYSAENQAQIQIDLKDIKKFNPMIDFSDKQALKNFADQLTQSIKANEKGEILIDSNKINPQCLHLIQKPSQILKTKKTIVDSLKELKKFDKKQLIAKGMKLKENKKYFLVINYIERPIQTQKFKISEDSDEVFEDYESLIEITVTPTSNDTGKLIWEVAEKDIYILTNTRSLRDAGKALIEKIQIIGAKEEKFLFALNEQALKKLSFLKEESDCVVFLPEKSLKILQSRIKSRRFFLNYKRYRNEIQKKVIANKGCIKIGKEKYLIYLFEFKPDIEIVLWDLKLFTRSEFEVKYNYYESFLKSKDKKTKKMLLILIGKYISIFNDEGFYFDEKACLESIRKFELMEK